VTDRAAILQRILDAGIVAVVRCDDPKPIVKGLLALADGGVTIAEITLTVPNALKVIREAKQILADRMLIGAGTVLDLDLARAARKADADFIVAPTLNVELIRYCRRKNIVVMPGTFTPTEALTAWDAGADVVKIFPAEVVGPAFFRALRGPLPHVKLMPTGGVDLGTARAFLEAGAVCLGIGNQLVDPALLAAGDFDALRERARQFVKVVADFRAVSAVD
jgi:2-dehydro-3-deoxyphosphogluconate aldolase/(4S)-4-hydroxy-2-oxoglutarate aldolase